VQGALEILTVLFALHYSLCKLHDNFITLIALWS
jgi:hypothetical protein